MGKAIRLILGFVLGGVAFGVVQEWPVRPMWVRPVETGTAILSFCTERKSILLLEYAPIPYGRLVFLVEKDVETGDELSRLQLPIEENCRFGKIAPLPDMKELFVISRHIDPASPQKDSEYDIKGQVIRWPLTYRILDARSLATIAGPFPLPGWEEYRFSPDGKWFWCYNFKSPYGHVVIESATGKIVLRFPQQARRVPIKFNSFAPDSNALAVHWVHRTGQHEIEIYDLPEGKKRFSQLLPDNATSYWIHLNKWEGDRIFMVSEALLPGTQTYEHYFFSFPVLPDRLGEPREEPQLKGYIDQSVGTLDRKQFTQVYGDRLVQVSTMPTEKKTDALQDILAWLDKTLGTKWSDPVYGRMRLDFIDRSTGKLLYDFSSAELEMNRMGGFVHDRVAGISPDGLRVASVYPFQHLIVGPHPQHGLIMWNADPFPRWPWALGTGLLVLIVLYFLPLRRKSKASLLAPRVAPPGEVNGKGEPVNS